MRSSFLTALGLSLAFSTLCGQVPITLTTGTYTQNFDSIGTGLPAGWSVYINSGPDSLGTVGTVTSASTAWNGTTAGTDFRNIATDNIAPGATTTVQNAQTNRALGWRPLSTASRNGAVTASFAGTTGLTVTALSVRVFTANDVAAAQTYILEYRVGTSGSFTAAAAAYTTAGPFSTVTLFASAAALDAVSNRSESVFVRLRGTATAGSGNLDTFAIDDFAVTTKTAQTISFAALPTRSFGDAPFTVSATASSGLAPTYSIVSGPATVSGNNITLTGAGSVTVRASQSGDATFGPAPPVEQTFTVNKATVFVAVTSPSATYDGAPHAASVTTTPSGLNLVVSYTGSAGTVYGPTPNAPTQAGTYAVTATLNEPNHQGTGSGTLTIARAPVSVTLNLSNALYDGLAHPASATTIPAGISVSYTYNGVTSAPANAGTYAVVGTVADLNYTGSATGSLVITKATATATLGTLSLVHNGASQPVAVTTDPSGRNVDVMYTGVGATNYGPSPTAPTAGGTYLVVAVMNDANYDAVATGTLVISPGPQTISFSRPADRVASDPAFALTASSSSGLPVTFTLISGSPGVATLAGNIVSLTGTTGTVTVRASQTGDLSHAPATSVDRAFEVVGSAIPPQIVIPPTGTTVPVGASASLNVVVSGSPAPTLQWRKNGVEIFGATDATLAFAAVTDADAGAYDVVATNSSGSIASTLVALIVGQRTQTITFEPPTTTLPAGNTLPLTATASSGLPVTFTLVAGSASLAGASLTGTGTVTIRANQLGNAAFSAAAPVERTFTFVTGVLSPFIVRPPENITVTVGEAATFRASAVGTPNPTYQWSKDGIVIPAATGATLVFENAKLADAARYTVAATNLAGTSTATATLNVRAPVEFTSQPADQAAFAGESISLSVAASGTPTPTYQWRKNGVALAGATRSTFIIPSAVAADAGRYDVVATNVLGALTSRAASIVVDTRDFSGTYHGQIEAGAATGQFSLLIRDRAQPAVFLARLPGSSQAVLMSGTVDTAGRFAFNGIPFGSTGVTVSVRGSIDDSSVTGMLMQGSTTAALGGTRSPRVTASSSRGGLYRGALVGSAADRAFAIVAPDGDTFLVVAMNGAVDSLRGRLSAGGQMTGTGAAQSTFDVMFTADAMRGVLRSTAGSATLLGANDAIGGTERLVNLSVRSNTQPAAPLITGFVVTGTSPKQVLLRAAGPALAPAPFSVPGALPDPTLQLFRGNAVVGQNDNWGTPVGNGTTVTAAATRVGAFPFPINSNDAGLVMTLTPGPYTVMIGGGNGTVLAEVYEVLESAETPGARRLVNASARGLVAPNAPLIAGFVISGTAPQRVLIRGIGPTLAAAPFNVAGSLANSQLVLFRGNTSLKTNDDWFRDADATLIRDAGTRAGAFALGAQSLDAAMLVYLEPGAYTAQVSGGANAANTAGIALVEVYEATP